MIPDVVVDIGNTRIKWGEVDPQKRSILRTVSLPEDPDAWAKELVTWGAERQRSWALTSVRPQRCERLRTWLEARGDRVVLLQKAEQLPLRVGLAEPDKAGIDRLLNAVAAKLLLVPGRGAVLVDAGSAVTVDWLDEAHTFKGGAIYPGLDLMAEALHRYTALLPRVEITAPVPALPAGATIPAMQVGIFLAVSGGIREAVRLYAEQTKMPPLICFTGGQAQLLAREMGLLEQRFLPLHPWSGFILWPEQTLIGILRSVEAMP